MTTTSIPAPLTVRSLLFDEAADGADLLARAIDEDTMAAALPQLSRAGRSAAGAELTDMAKGLLELDLGGLALAGWRKHRDLVAAATRTSEHPGSTELVELATHASPRCTGRRSTCWSTASAWPWCAWSSRSSCWCGPWWRRSGSAT